MKLFQKTALATAIAAVPFLSVNAMEALDDATLSNMTGQAGVTIETTVSDAGIKIGSIEYTDTAASGGSDIGGGSLVINNAGNDTDGIVVQGVTWDSSSNSWDFDTPGSSTTKQTIDIDSNGNLITNTTATGANVGENTIYGAATGTPGSTGNEVKTTAQKITVGQVLLRSAAQQANPADNSTGAKLVSGLELTMESGPSAAHILNLSDGDSTNAGDAAKAYLSSTKHAIGYEEGMGTNSANGVNNGAVLAGLGYTRDASTGDLGTATGGGAVGKGASMAIVSKSSSRIANLDVEVLDSAIGITGLSYGGGENGTELMDSTSVIWAIGSGADSGVYIQGSDSVGTLNIADISIGDATELGQSSASIGSIKVSNINQAGSVTRIYGH